MPRHRLARLSIAALAILAATAAGCGDSDSRGYGGDGDSNDQAPTATATTPTAPPGATARQCGATVAGAAELRVTGVECDLGRAVVAAWVEKPACSRPADASRWACTANEGYRCLGAATDAGIAVSCARPGSSVAFLARRPRDT